LIQADQVSADMTTSLSTDSLASDLFRLLKIDLALICGGYYMKLSVAQMIIYRFPLDAPSHFEKLCNDISKIQTFISF